MKFVAGTMDNEDAVEISNHLRNLDRNTIQMTDQINKQVIINNNLIKNVDSIIQHVNVQQSKLQTYLQNITAKANAILETTDRSKFTLQIYADINLINRQLEKISDIILMSRLNVLSHDVLTDEEVNKHNISATILPFIRNCVLFRNNFLIFAISIPKFTEEAYYNALVIPFPNNHFEELDHSIEKVILGNNNVYISDDATVLKKKLIIHKNNCIRNAFEINNACKLRWNNVTSIEEIYDGLVIIKNLPITEIIQNCTLHKVIIKNNNIIKFNNCNMKINSLTFKNEIENFTSSKVIPVTHANFTKLFDKVTLEKLNIDSIENREIIKHIQFENNVRHYTSLGITSIIIIALVIIIILKFDCKFGRKSEITTKIELHEASKENNALRSIYRSGSIHSSQNNPFAEAANASGGGGVI